MALTTKEKALYILAAVAVAMGLFAIWYFFFNDDECDPNNNGYTVKGKQSDKCKVQDPKITNAVPPSGCSSWISDTTFPIKRCSWGSKVKALQVKLGIGDDGRFGPITESTLKSKFNKTDIGTQAEYDAIVAHVSTTNPIATTSPVVPVSPTVVGQKVYANAITNIRSTPYINDGFINNKVCELPANYEPAPTILEVKDCSKAGTGCPVLNNYFWYKIQFQIANCSAKSGWIRQDVVTVK